MNNIEPDIIESSEPVIMKPKRKPKNKLETIKEKPEQIIVSFEVSKPVIEEVKPIIEEVKPIEVKPIEEDKPVEKNIKITELVECPDCHKKMTKKSLKYSHKQNCITHKQSEPIEKKPKQHEKPKHIEIPITGKPCMVPTEPVNHRLNRMNERVKKIELLASQAF
jgi:hypothetical protein